MTVVVDKEVLTINFPSYTGQIDNGQVQALSKKDLAALRDLEGKAQKRQCVMDMITLLEQTYPDCFNRKDPKPLKLGTAEELLATPQIMSNASKATLRDALKLYTLRRAYQKAVIKGDVRYDLQGNPCGKVEPYPTR